MMLVLYGASSGQHGFSPRAVACWHVFAPCVAHIFAPCDAGVVQMLNLRIPCGALLCSSYITKKGCV
jgi:hypothetical protein